MPSLTDAQVQVAGEAFLDEAYVFYVLLASKIQRVYGSVGLVQSLGPEDEALVELAGAPRGEHSASPHADVEAAVCHCHVAMGDLLRCWAGAGFPQEAGGGSAAPRTLGCCVLPAGCPSIHRRIQVQDDHAHRWRGGLGGHRARVSDGRLHPRCLGGALQPACCARDLSTSPP